MISSTAGLIVYEGGGGYTAAKHAETALAETLRLELCGRPVRVIEIDPGMVRTDEFATGPLRRRRGQGRRRLRRGGRDRWSPTTSPTASPWRATRPHHVNIDRIVVRPLAQAAQHKVHRVRRDDRPTVRKPVGRRHPGHHQPQPAAPGRQLDRATCGGAAARRADPLVVDLGFGATPVTTVELRTRLARSAPDVRVVGLEIDPARVAAAQPPPIRRR